MNKLGENLRLSDLIIDYIRKKQPVTEKELYTYLRNKKIRDIAKKKNVGIWENVYFVKDDNIGWWSRDVSNTLRYLRSIGIIGRYDEQARKIARACTDFILRRIEKNGLIIVGDVLKEKDFN